MSKTLTYVGSLSQTTDGRWNVRTDVVFRPDQQLEARCFGEWLHRTIMDKCKSEGYDLPPIGGGKKPLPFLISPVKVGGPRLPWIGDNS